jgi:hypothetical protein
MEERDMLEIDIKLVPYGIKDREQIIGRITIWNDGTGTNEVGNYGYKIVTDGDKLHKGKYKGFMRRDGVLKLIKNILNKI